MRRFEKNVRCASLGGLLERVFSGVRGVSAGTFDDPQLLAARLGVHDPDVRRGLGARRLASRRCGAEEHEPGGG